MRITSHPSQFILLSSKDDNVIKNSIFELKIHNWLFDTMGLDNSNYYAINIHGGAKGQSQKLIDTVNSLPATIKNRLTFENDERSYSTKELYSVYKETGIPIVFDSHHASFNSDNVEDDFHLALSTWKAKPLTHLSNTTPGLENGSFTERGAHSDYVHYIPKYQLDNQDKIDIDFEFKMKNLAIFKAVNDFGVKL
jgi:UV DNA damage endonuclease